MAIWKQLSPVKTQLIFADMLSTDTPLLNARTRNGASLESMESKTRVYFCHRRLRFIKLDQLRPISTHWGREKMAAIFKCIFLNENV